MTPRVIAIVAGAALLLTITRWLRGRRVRKFYRGVMPLHENDIPWDIADDNQFGQLVSLYYARRTAADPLRGTKT